MNIRANGTLALAAALALIAPASAANAQSAALPGWRLVYVEEFNGTAVDPTHWNSENVAWPYNNELEYYQPQQATVGMGVLNIKAEHRSVGGRSYVSARLNTSGRFAQQYGRFEARIQMPVGLGYWPAFWLLPAGQEWPPELDIMEYIGSRPTTVYLTQHWGTDSADHQHNGTTYTGPNFSGGYHNFAIEWSPTRIDWLVDGVLRFTTNSNIPQEPMYILLNLAIGGDLPGNPNGATVFPQSMLVDWVRVYMRDTALVNPSFESSGAGNAPAGWQLFGNAQQSTDGARTGAHSVRADGTAAGAPFYSGTYQDLPASPGQVWTATAFVQHLTANHLVPGNLVDLKIEWYNSAGQQISFNQTQALSDTSPQNTPLPASVQATAPAGTATARLAVVLVQNGPTSGSAYFDDATFTYATPAVTDCTADFNGIGGVTIQDIFDFLSAWFDGSSRADFNQQSGTDVQDIFDFLSAWFTGC